jgi:predicted membrane metal-binding protein
MDPRCLREIQIRAGMAAVLMAVFTLFLGFDPRFWLLPVAVAALIWLKWRLAPPEDDEPGAGAP